MTNFFKSYFVERTGQDRTTAHPMLEVSLILQYSSMILKLKRTCIFFTENRLRIDDIIHDLLILLMIILIDH